MECAQITVSGGSGSLPTETVSIPGLYNGTDPGITISIYNDFGDYIIPGPKVFTCGAGGDETPSTPVSSSVAAPVATSSSAPIASSSAPSATSSSSPVVTDSPAATSSPAAPIA